MKKQIESNATRVLGVMAPAPRLTPLGAALLAGGIALAGGAILLVFSVLIGAI